MIYAFDTYYATDKAKTACIGFPQWSSLTVATVHTDVVPIQNDYESGQFYKRELPCILNLLRQIELKETDTIVIDGFVHLDDDGKLGLGGHLYMALPIKVSVIGVAKSNFAGISLLKRAVIRGESKKPLYITAIGTDLEEASFNIGQMAGNYRFPDLLKKLDLLSRA